MITINQILINRVNHYFLNQWAKYIEPVAGTYAYCLLPNHFHFLIKTHELQSRLRIK